MIPPSKGVFFKNSLIQITWMHLIYGWNYAKFTGTEVLTAEITYYTPNKEMWCFSQER